MEGRVSVAGDALPQCFTTNTKDLDIQLLASCCADRDGRRVRWGESTIRIEIYQKEMDHNLVVCGRVECSGHAHRDERGGERAGRSSRRTVDSYRARGRRVGSASTMRATSWDPHHQTRRLVSEGDGRRARRHRGVHGRVGVSHPFRTSTVGTGSPRRAGRCAHTPTFGDSNPGYPRRRRARHQHEIRPPVRQSVVIMTFSDSPRTSSIK